MCNAHCVAHIHLTWRTCNVCLSFSDFLSHTHTHTYTHTTPVIFNLAENGTDLGFDTDRFTDTAHKQIPLLISPEFVPYMKCAVWDWGDRFCAANSHLKEISEYFSEVDRDPSLPAVPAYILDGIRDALVKFPRDEAVSDAD